MADFDDSADYWCNCQAIEGTANYPGPWHPVADQPWYPCAKVLDAARRGDPDVR